MGNAHQTLAFSMTLKFKIILNFFCLPANQKPKKLFFINLKIINCDRKHPYLSWPIFIE
jgi:hypothetical protein